MLFTIIVRGVDDANVDQETGQQLLFEVGEFLLLLLIIKIILLLYGL